MKYFLLLLAACPFVLRTQAQDTMDNGARFNQYGKKVSRTPLITEVRDGILVFESKDQDYRLWFDTTLRTLVQRAWIENLTLSIIG